MARPKNKAELLQLSVKNYQKLNDLIASYSQEEQMADFPAGMLNRNIRDVLAHLYHWHLMMLGWYNEGMQGKKPAMPAQGYTWKSTPELNKWIWEKYNQVTLDEIKEMFSRSFEEVQKIIKQHSNEDLFTKKKYKWTGSTSLGAYLISATSSHYDWAYKLIRKSKK